MCGCCTSNNVVEFNKTPPTESRRSSSIIFEKLSKQGDYKKKYEYVATIGHGSFGKVRLYRDRQCKAINYAIKTLKKDIFNAHSIESLKREIDILRSLDHPNIVKYFETYEDDLLLHIVMEHIPGDNLFKMITNKVYVNFTERDICEIMTCLLKSVLFLQHNNIVHRDIKPDNILFSLPGKYSSLKLIDFGLSIPRNAKRERYRVGTPYYMAPEMIRGKYCYESDMWSIGVIMYVLVTGHQPFRGRDQEKVFEKISEGKYDIKLLNKQGCSPQLKDLIKKILIVNPKKRLGVEGALNHEWFSLFENKTLNTAVISKDIIQAIKDFQNQNLLQKEIMYYLAKIATDSEVAKLKQAFSIIDKDNSGEIEYEEIPRIFAELKIHASEDELKNIFDSLDFHNDGKVNYSEFIAATLSSIEFDKEDRLLSAFRYFDVNNSGYITLDSVIEALKQNNIIVNEKELGQIFEGMNKKDKKIQFDEFNKLFYMPNSDK